MSCAVHPYGMVIKLQNIIRGTLPSVRNGIGSGTLRLPAMKKKGNKD